MSDGGFGTAPSIPEALQVYNSYEIDPQWQRKFSIIWASLLSAAILFAFPHLCRSIRNGRAFTGLFGIMEDWEGLGKYDPIQKALDRPRKSAKSKSKSRSRSSAMKTLEGVLSMIGSVTLWSPPGLGLNLGQIFVVAAYLVIVLICIIMDSELVDNANRAGFMAIAQLPVVFLFATKNSIVSLLLGPGNGYEKLNYIHRWSSRTLFLGAVVHGSLWIRNHLEYDIPIIGQQKETSGVAALGVLCGLVLTSLRPVRRWFWEWFWVVHVLGFVAFFVTICYHTIYAPPWIFPPLAFYAFDVLLRLVRFRIKDATLSAVDKNMTIIRIPDCDSSWIAGQHVRLRVFFSGRVFESHPLTIMNAPRDVSCLALPGLSHPPSSLSSVGNARGIILGARVTGDWTRALNGYAEAEGKALKLLNKMWDAEKKKNPGDGDSDSLSSSASINDPAQPLPEIPIQVMLDGPYGGCSLDLGAYETVLLMAGGSGATFTIGVLDDIVGRCLRQKRRNGEKTQRIEFVWCIRSYGQLNWFAEQLGAIAEAVADAQEAEAQGKDDGTGDGRMGLGLDLHISIYVTCLCNPEAVPPIPNSDVLMLAQRPEAGKILKDLTTPPRNSNLARSRSGLDDKVGPSSKSSEGPSSVSSTEALGIAEVPRLPPTSANADANIGYDVDAEASLSSESASPSAKLRWVGLGGGVGVCASGPGSLTREVSNAVAKLSLVRGVELGGAGLHTEVFSV